jgi:hypothetical protein
VASTRKPDVAVFHSAGCHLCERALEQVRGLRDELDFELREIDIAGDPALEEAYAPGFRWSRSTAGDVSRITSSSMRSGVRLHKRLPSRSC